MGTSFGGRVAREIALAAPGRVKGLWVIGAGRALSLTLNPVMSAAPDCEAAGRGGLSAKCSR